MTKATGFHVRHDFQPELAYELLLLLRSDKEGISEESLQIAANNQGFELSQRKSYDKLFKSLSELGLISKNEKKIFLTYLGEIIAEVALYQNHLVGELIHFLYYTLYDFDKSLRFSWSYQTICNYLWSTAPCP